MPDTLLARDIGLLQLFDQSYAGWTRARPYALPSEDAPPESMLERDGGGQWQDIERYLTHSGSNMFVRNLVDGLGDLYELDDGGITESNWQQLDAEVRKRHQSADWVHAVLDRAGVERVITDPYGDPLLNAREAIGERYRSVFRINALAVGWHPKSRDHNGNRAARYAERLGQKVETFDQYLDLLAHICDTLRDRGQVALKNALAYDREINFDDTNESLARSGWGKKDPTPAERKAFGDVVVDRLCKLAGERDIPCQMHLGTAIIRGSHPMNVAGLIDRHPKTRFLLMHLAYPWGADLMGLGFVYRNVWLDLTWSWLLSPSYFKRFVHEAIEVLPDESRMMLGGDNWHVEETYATLKSARRLIAEVLDEKVASGYFSEADARRLAKKILHDNAVAFFKLDA